MVPDVGYVEVVAVALEARGTLLQLEPGGEVSLGAFMLLTIFRQMRSPGRHQRTFARVDRRNLRSLELCDRVGLVDERPDPYEPVMAGQGVGLLGQVAIWARAR